MADLLNTAFPVTKKPLHIGKGRNVSSLRNVNKVDQSALRLKRAQKYLKNGQLTMIGDGLYETEVCNSCNKQHRVASVHTQCCCKTRQTCTLPSILSKTTSVLSSSTDILPSILKDNAAIKAETVPFSREFCREMLSQEESVLTERLLFERKLLEEAERKHQMLELEEARYGLSQQKELEEEKETFEQAKKRRLALETILKTLNDIPEPTISKQRFQEPEYTGGGGILRYNYSTASRKAVRIKSSSDDTASESNYTGTNSSISKYLTFASSQYLTTSSCSYVDTDGSSSSSDESILLVNDSELRQAEQLASSTVSAERPVSDQVSSSKRLKHKEIFMPVNDVRLLSKSTDQTDLMITNKESTAKSAPALTGMTPDRTPIPKKITNCDDKDIVPLVLMTTEQQEVPKQESDKCMSSTTEQLELTIPSLVITQPSSNAMATMEDTPIVISATTCKEESTATYSEVVTAEIEPIILDQNSDSAQSQDAPPELEVVSAEAINSSGSTAKSAASSSTNSSNKSLSSPQESSRTIMARAIVHKAMEAVIQEYGKQHTNHTSSSDEEEPLACSSDEYLTLTATILVRNAIMKVHKDLTRRASSTSTKSSSFSFSFMKKLPSAKSIRKMFSF